MKIIAEGCPNKLRGFNISVEFLKLPAISSQGLSFEMLQQQKKQYERRVNVAE